METVKKPKVGAWIKTLCILQLIGSVFGLWSIRSFSKIDELNDAREITNNALPKALQVPEITTLSLTVGLLFSIILGISVILILRKMELGIYIYFTVVVAQIVYTLVSTGFKWTILGSLIMPVLMGIFIWKKKEIFSTQEKNIEA